ncbi:tRNA (guanine(37)-N1)-methyltransferase [Tribolium castaneum]|uniref:tRNA (guanine(37)-N1)-methyltransferase n=1 Tax=Tribolium castaneum TaxID=7070 RepID=UPI00046BFE39|nr:PREDICTED: tRNA (guanine(37)-N1)-methyltransferase [Tribolium castaneum]|eukprot:XP_015839993.1 PREDICTED: tRNA (guanine(37)-N1)-methyltransferase [Tribolium castaneum]
MTTVPNLKPPAQVAGLTTLDKNLFKKNITVPCLILKNVKISSVLPFVKNYLLKIENFKPVCNVTTGESHVYFNPEIIGAFSDLPPETQKLLNDLCVQLELKPLTLNYENFSIEGVFRAVLPPNVEGMSSFTKVGHIVHVNLREHLVPFKDIIGQVLFDKVPNCRTVVNKVGSIDNTYRNFQMEVLRGENDTQTHVRENKCVFEFDFAKVYWNSRLCTEHERIVNMIESGDVVFDVFAGVGPFSVPLARKKCQVFANDLNPESFKWLNHNFKINKVGENYFKSYNKDGREFILGEVKELLPKFSAKNVFILMNLPALAVDFLTTFVDLFSNDELPEFGKHPVVVVYCFAKGEDFINIAKKSLCEKIGRNVEEKITDVFRVRTVSSLKEMMRITFKLDREILVKNYVRKRKNSCVGVESKKLCDGEKQEEAQ